MDRKLPIYHFDADIATVLRSKMENIRIALTKNGLILLRYIVTYKRSNCYKFRLQ